MVPDRQQIRLVPQLACERRRTQERKCSNDRECSRLNKAQIIVIHPGNNLTILRFPITTSLCFNTAGSEDSLWNASSTIDASIVTLSTTQSVAPLKLVGNLA